MVSKLKYNTTYITTIICHLPDPPTFSVVLTFKTEYTLFVRLFIHMIFRAAKYSSVKPVYVEVVVVQFTVAAEMEFFQKRTDFNRNLFVRNPIIYKQLIRLLTTYICTLYSFQNTEHKTIFT